MAVYTDFSDEEFDAFMAGYDLGAVLSVKGIAEGVENSNYLLATEAGQFILTLYEKRVEPADLPFFLGLMEHLAGARHHLPAAGARPQRQGARTGSPGGRRRSSPSCPGMWVRRPQRGALRRGRRGAGAAASRRRGLRADAAERAVGRRLAAALRAVRRARRRGARRASAPRSSDELDYLEAHWPRDLPEGDHPRRPLPRQRLLPRAASCPG